MPDWTNEIRQRLADLRLAATREAEIVEELAQHLDDCYEELLSGGASDEEASRAALAGLSNSDWLTRELRRVEPPVEAEPIVSGVHRSGNMIADLWQDIRYAIRMVRKNLGFTAIAVLTLALGVGANTAVFSVINGLLLRPLPVERPDELFAVSRGDGAGPPASYPDYMYYRDQNQVFSGLASAAPASLNFGGFESGGGDQVGGVVMGEITGEVVSGNYFSTLGVNAELGRTLTPEDDQVAGAHPVAVVSHGFWKNRLGAASDVIGKTLVLNGHGFTVIGVMPESFTGALFGALFTPHVWAPLAMQAQLLPGAPDRLHDHRDNWLGLIGRLKPNVAPPQAAAALNTLDGQLRQHYAEPERGRGETTLSLLSTRGVILPHQRRMITILSTLATLVVGAVLLIACANVASLLLARATARRREIAVRLALGASRWRLIRQLLTESLLLAILSAVTGLILASWAVNLLIKFAPTVGLFTFAPNLKLDSRVFVFTLAVSLLTGVIVGLAPALQSYKADLVLSLKDESGNAGGGSRRSRPFGLRGLLVSAQVGISLVLLITTGLFIRSSMIAATIDPGFDTENGLVLTLDLGLQDYTETRGKQFQKELKEHLAALPGVKAVSLASYVPLSPGGPQAEVRIEGTEPARESDRDLVGIMAVDSDYFQTMGTGLLHGRNFGSADREDSPSVAIINETTAKRYWPGVDAIGKRLRLGAADAPLREVVGIVQDSKWRYIGERPRSVVYRPISQSWSPLSSFVLRSTGQPNALLADVRREVQGLDRNLPVQVLRTLPEHVSEALWPAQLGAGLLAVFGLLALTLAAVGLSAVIAYLVSQRTREIGIRLALGAQARDVLKLVVWQGLKLTFSGVVIGLFGAFALTRLLENLLYGLSPTDPLTFLAITTLLVAVALLACYIPARRATKVDPLVALRYE
jgi:macrolide transport system ATP-binding/permease protein